MDTREQQLITSKMKKTVTLISFVFMAFQLALGQTGYTPNSFGDFYKRDLSNPANAALIGITQSQIGASDFNTEGILYAISGADNGLYILDTTDASSTFIATVPPSGGEFWTGMAIDPTDGTMYVCSTDGNNSSFFTMNPEDGSKTLIASGAIEDGVVGIAFDNDGQMYGIFLVRKFYMIDKTNGSATFIGDFDVAVTAFPHHGLDFDPESETMFMTSYNAFTFDNELWTVDLGTAATSLVGSVGFWTGSIAVAPPEVLAANFISDATEICEGEMIHFTDQSTGNPESWLWTFEGGDPATSTEQYPTVNYGLAGFYDVTLEVSSGSASSSSTLSEYITVYEVPSPEVQGPDTVCTNHTESYSTENTGGTTFEWEVNGGEIWTGAGTSEIVVVWDEPGNGSIVVTESTPNCDGTSEIFEVVIDPCTFINEQMDMQLRIYPNPAADRIYINLTGLSVKELSVCNSIGQTVYHSELSQSDKEVTLNISEYNPGLYYVRSYSENGDLSVFKFIKSK
jgi:PKD repeat protein